MKKFTFLNVGVPPVSVSFGSLPLLSKLIATNFPLKETLSLDRLLI